MPAWSSSANALAGFLVILAGTLRETMKCTPTRLLTDVEPDSESTPSHPGGSARDPLGPIPGGR